MVHDENGWKEWSKYVLKELERLNECYKKLDDKVDSVRREIAVLKVKSGIWGAVAGMIPVAVLVVLFLLNKGV